MIDAQRLRLDFPILSRQLHGKPLVYLDNAATSHKPRQVVEAMTEYYYHHTANVHRGVHLLSDESTQAWEESRATIATFLGAQTEELIMVRNTTEALNGIAYGWGDHAITQGDVILTTVMEHHSNFVVWQELCKRKGAELVVVGVDEHGRLDLDAYTTALANQPVALVAVSAVSNVTGVINPLEYIIGQAHAHGAVVVVDAAQAGPHMRLDFAKSQADFMALSGHKMLGPMGSGVLLVRKTMLENNQMRPWLFGGGMIGHVTTTGTVFHPDACERFVAGTPDVASAVGLARACRYLDTLGMAEVEQHDRDLVQYALTQLAGIPRVKIIGPIASPATTRPGTHQPVLDRLGSVAFIYQGVHAHDVAQVLDSEGVAVRSGHHCAQPLHDAQEWQATVRVSFQVYTTRSDIDACVRAIGKVQHVFGSSDFA